MVKVLCFTQPRSQDLSSSRGNEVVFYTVEGLNQPRSQGLATGGGKKRDPGNEVGAKSYAETRFELQLINTAVKLQYNKMPPSRTGFSISFKGGILPLVLLG